MNLYILLAITVFVSFLIAVNQRKRGLKFGPSFFKSIIAVGGVLGTIWKIIN
jgi:hypothetical protein|tara:strand:- start:589 stop:744 length:156 start_codon:yes stop_codon:yes gene_type:complete